VDQILNGAGYGTPLPSVTPNILCNYSFCGYLYVNVAFIWLMLQLFLQGWDDPYVTRTHEGLLKWKYPEMNSVDFLFEVS
jgi:hypothetical protein